MKFSDIGGLSLGALKQRRLRSALTILGIMIGSAVVVGLVGATQGLSDSITGELGKLGSDSITMRSSSDSFRLTATEERLITRIPNIRYVIPMYQGAVQLTSGRETKQVIIYGVNQDYLPILLDGITVDEGTFVSRFDAGGMVLGSDVANPAGEAVPFARLNQAVTAEVTQFVGDELETTKRTFVVRGIVAEYGPTFSINIDTGVAISLDAARALLGQSSYTAIIIKASSPDHVEQVVAQLEEMFGEDVSIITSQQILDIVGSITGIISLFLGGIAGISLVVAGIGIANIMFVAVMERTREIGVLKALGFQRGDILWLFIMEALLTGFIGGILGIGLGILFGYGITSLVGGGGPPEGSEDFGGNGGGFGGDPSGFSEITLAPSFDPSLLLIALGFAVLIAVIAGLYPSWKASKMNPVEALRSE